MINDYYHNNNSKIGKLKIKNFNLFENLAILITISIIYQVF